MAKRKVTPCEFARVSQTQKGHPLGAGHDIVIISDQLGRATAPQQYVKLANPDNPMIFFWYGLGLVRTGNGLKIIQQVHTQDRTVWIDGIAAGISEYALSAVLQEPLNWRKASTPSAKATPKKAPSRTGPYTIKEFQAEAADKMHDLVEAIIKTFCSRLDITSSVGVNKQHGIFSFYQQVGDQYYWLFNYLTTGELEIQFQWLLKRPYWQAHMDDLVQALQDHDIAFDLERIKGRPRTTFLDQEKVINLLEWFYTENRSAV